MRTLRAHDTHIVETCMDCTCMVWYCNVSIVLYAYGMVPYILSKHTIQSTMSTYNMVWYKWYGTIQYHTVNKIIKQ